MRNAYAVERVRAAERELMARLPEGTLMQRAAAGLAATAAEALGRVYGGRVVVLAGSGDNGGDALYAGARLARRGAAVRAVLLNPERAHGGGLDALRAAGGRAVTERGEALRALTEADLVLDGIVGIGGRGGLRPEAAEYVHAIGERATVLAVDLPSGIDADTGEVAGEAVRADITVTFGTHKPGLLIDPGREHAGVVRLVEIGLDLPSPPDAQALQHAETAALLPRPDAESDKYRRGVVGIAAGSARYPGAAVLAVSAALRGGAGAVRYAGPAAADVVRAHPETLVTDGGPGSAGRVQAWVVGPGIGTESRAEQVLDEALAEPVPLLVDADGLGLLARRGPKALADRAGDPGRPVLLTPHAGEAAALLAGAGRPAERARVEAERLAHARQLAEAYGCAVLLKGSTTVVAPAPGGPAAPVRVNPTGTPWLATAGSGDVLSGLAGALLAAGLPALDAASAAAYLHGLAARRAAAGGSPITSLDVAAELPGAWRDVLSG
ncbi:bifunctional ADP-dependent NAD(P)H-hydrate dehydratase/NAD(P)H-hydrate epimerase [Phaeacidiphilus oryzae]|uniref:bifunctional ADP-dependent NAD(P)H-hydrate dehydratase/NAD(P)H-hydrate epimerase n=1 Tax=Phaeacidiphilus oryzae TaxID=348818 RepID=UPI00055F7D05|nr:bifunctional ADP-dependent NAD(P)H-hydrate dehydratase/NAD(P)H-hydrate epimerase [Phaeacidiphilus oryzae]